MDNAPNYVPRGNSNTAVPSIMIHAVIIPIPNSPIDSEAQAIYKYCQMLKIKYKIQLYRLLAYNYRFIEHFVPN